MKLVLQIASIDKTKGRRTIQESKDFNTQPSATQTIKGKQLVAMMTAIEKVFKFLGDDLVELSTESKSMKNKVIETVWWWEKSKLNYGKNAKTNEKNNTERHFQAMLKYGEVSLMTTSLQQVECQM